MFKIYMRLLGFARPIRKYAIPYFFYSLFYALFNSLTFLLIMPILKTMFDADYTFVYVEKLPPLAFNQEYLTALFNFTYSHLFTEYNPENVLLLLAIVTIFVSLLSNLFRYMGAWTVENMRTRTLQRMRNEMFSKVVDMNVGYFSDQRKGDIISKITSDVGVVQFCITNTLQVAFREPFLIIGYTVMMVAISWELALFSVLFLPVVALIIGSIVKRLRHPARTSQQRMGELVSTLDESLSGIKVIKSYNATGYVKQKFYDLSEDLARLTLSRARRQQLASPMSEFLGISAVGVILVFGGSLVFKDALSPEGFIAFIAMFSQITRPVRTFIDQFSNINRIPRHPLLVRRQPRGDRRHLVRDQARRNRGPGRPFGRRQVDPQRTHTAFLRRKGGRHPDRRGFGARLHAGQPARPHERRGAGHRAFQ